MPAVLGVEGGGSHTHAVVVDTSGRLLGAAGSRDPSNWEDVGIEAAGGAIKSCVRFALSSAGVAPGDVVSSVFALAGVDFPIDELRLSGVPEALGLAGPVRIVNDAFAALRAGASSPFGVVAVAGTGSVVAGRNPAGDEFRTLGLGPMFGDSGSASEVSEAAVNAVAEAHVGRSPTTELTARLCEVSGSASVVDFLEGAARGRIDSAGFAPIVVRTAAEGDVVARGILRRAGETLGGTMVHVVRSLGMEGVEFELVLAGWLFRSGSQDLVEGVVETVTAVAGLAAPMFLLDPPVVGAALLAMEDAGAAPASDERIALSREVATSLGLSPG
jgi:N-acetylglucosamine kinase-like BadF-type ATPase